MELYLWLFHLSFSHTHFFKTHSISYQLGVAIANISPSNSSWLILHSGHRWSNDRGNSFGVSYSVAVAFELQNLNIYRISPWFFTDCNIIPQKKWLNILVNFVHKLPENVPCFTVGPKIIKFPWKSIHNNTFIVKLSTSLIFYNLIYIYTKTNVFTIGSLVNVSVMCSVCDDKYICRR